MKLKTWQIILLSLVFGGAISFAMWAGGEWRKYQGPDMLRVSLSGELYAQFRDRVFVYSRDGSYRKTINLARWGIEQSTGGFDVFSNGDLLMLEGSHQQSALLKLLTYLRMEKLLTGSSGAAEADRQLVRCSTLSTATETGKCQRLEKFTRTFASTFRLQIDAQDRIFLADTSRDRLSWLTPDGSVLDDISSGFRFPNQLALEQDHSGNAVLVVANTNHNELTVIPLQENKFSAASEWQHHKVDGAVAASTHHIWPLESVLIGDDRYVLQQDDNMGHGVVMKYSRDGKFLTPFTMPADSDVMAMARFNGEVLVGDVAHLKIWRYGTDGKLKGDFTSPEMDSYVQKLAAKKQHFQTREKQAWWVFSILLAIGFVVAIVSEQRAKKIGQQQAVADAKTALVFIVRQGESNQPSPDDPHIHWIAKNGRRMRMMRMIFGSIILLLMIGDVLLVAERYAADDAVIQHTFTMKLFFFQLGKLIFFVGFAWFIERMLEKMSVGILREWIILRDASGKAAVGRNADVLLFPNAIAIGGVMVSIGPRKHGELPERSIFDRLELQQWLAPRLINAREQTGLDTLVWDCRHKPLQTAFLVVLIILVVGFRFL
jgi:hypothetical protein